MDVSQMQIQLLYLIVTNIAHFLTGGDGNIGAMIEIFESSYTPTISQDIFDGIKRKVMQTLEEGSYLSPLHRELNEKSKYMRFTDIKYYHPNTSFSYTFKEKVACLISQWYNEYLDLCQVEENEYHKQPFSLHYTITPFSLHEKGVGNSYYKEKLNWIDCIL